MPDIVDLGNERADEILKDALAERIRNTKPGPAPTGFCHFCEGEIAKLAPELPADARFCSAECRDDWEVEQQAKMRNPGLRPGAVAGKS